MARQSLHPGLTVTDVDRSLLLVGRVPHRRDLWNVRENRSGIPQDGQTPVRLVQVPRKSALRLFRKAD